MKAPTTLLFLLILIANSKGRKQTRIIGGKVAKPGDIPSVVAILTSSLTQFCGGTLITRKHVLSAAHCMVKHKDPKRVLVVGTEVILPKRRTRGTFDVKNIVNHPRFDKKSFRNDFAIIELHAMLSVSRVLNMSPMSTIRPPAGTRCVIAGWGYTDEDDDEPSAKLLVAQIVVRPDSDCSKPPVNSDPKYDICAGVQSGAQDACFGDSGGPMICEGRLAGVISFGIGCGRKGLYGIYADVVAAKEWITSVISDKSVRKLKAKKRTSKVPSLYAGEPIVQALILLNVVNMSL